MTASYQVVFTGELRPGVNAEQAARDFAAVFKTPEEKAWRLILDRQEHILKREVDEANAERYREVLEEIGLQVRIEPAGTPPGAAEAAAAARPESPSAAEPSAADYGAPKPPPVGDTLNPYAPPQADLTPPHTDDDGPMTGPHPVPANHGWLWIKDAYALFRLKPLSWFGAISLIYLINFVLGMVPLVGALVGFLLGPVFAGGLMSGARTLDRHGKARASMAFDGFSGPALQLALLGLLYLVGLLVAALVAGVAVMGVGLASSAGLEAMSSGDPEALAAALSPMALLLMLLVFLAAFVPVLMAYWFAPALVMLEGLSAPEAMGASFRGCWMNMLPFLIYGLVFLGLLLALVLAAGVLGGLVAGLASALLGSAAFVIGFLLFVLAVPVLLALVAVSAASTYTGYRDIFRHLG